jgi:mRNA-degrading endonuclease toxin of MazEF toxin-antitoxin module
MSETIARRGEIWIVNLGEPPRRHWAVVVSVDARNRSRFTDTVLIVPFGSKAVSMPTAIAFEAGETGLPGPSHLRGDLIQLVSKARLIEPLPRPLSDRRMRDVCLAIRRSFDPDAPADNPRS